MKMTTKAFVYIIDKIYDFRVSTLPTINGESIVMRILDKTKAMIKLGHSYFQFCLKRVFLKM